MAPQFLAEGTVHFGSAADTGTVVLAPLGPIVTNVISVTSIDGGTLKLGSTNGAGLISGTPAGLTVGSGATAATLDINGFATQAWNLTGTSAGTITNSGAATTLQTENNTNSTFAGVIQDGASGSGGMSLHVSGAGGTTLTLTGANTYTGGTTIDAGQTLQLGNGGTTGSIVGNVTANGTLAFDRSDNVTFGNTISGAGGIAQNGPGNVTLTGSNSGFSGIATLNAGTLTLGSANALGTGGVTFAGSNTALLATTNATVNGTITVNPNFVSNFSATFGATAGNTLTLAGSNDLFQGTTTVHFGSAAATGTVVLAPANNLIVDVNGAVSVDGGVLKLGSIFATTIGAEASLTVGSGSTAATLDLNGFAAQAPNLSGTGTITNSGAATTLQTENKINSTFGGVIQNGAGVLSLEVSGSGGTTLTLTGANTYTGGTTIDAGQTLQLGNGGTTGSIAGNVTANGTLAFDRSDNVTFGNTISGAGGIAQNGPGNVTLTGSNSGFSGIATLNAGTLTLGSANALGTGGVTLNNNTALLSTTTATVSGPLTTSFGPGISVTFGATAGNTLTLAASAGNLTQFLAEGTVHFGSAADTGTVVLAPLGPIVTNVISVTSIDGGTLKLGSTNGAGLISGTPAGLTVGSGATAATLDINGFATQAWNLTGTSAGTITNSGAATTLQTENKVNSTFGGVIQNGAGVLSLEVSGSGGTTLTLTGANTYTGGTTIDAGQTLQLGNGGTTGSIVGNVTTNGTLAFDRSDNVTFGNTISGAGGIAQNGPGTTALTNTDTYTGATVINAGTLEVDGSIADSSSVTVNSGGTLSGTGIVDPPVTTVMAGGTLAPGNPSNPTGTLTITGNLAFQTGATYRIQITPSTSAITNVGGVASLAGAVQVVLLPGSYAKRTYDILHANGGLNGTTFTALDLLSPNFGGSLGFSATDAFFSLTSATLGAGTALNQNQQSVANAINSFFNSGGALPAAFSPGFALTGASLANALTQLDGEAATGAERGALNMMDQFLELMLDPFVDGRSGAGWPAGGGAVAATSFAPEPQSGPEHDPDIALAYGSVLKAPPRQTFDQRWSAWGSGFGGSGIANGNAAVGSTTVTASDYGGAAGLDYHFTPNLTAGFALAGGGTNWSLAQGLGGGRGDTFEAGIYTVARFGGFYAAGDFAFANHWMKTSRIAFAGDQLTASFNAQTYGGRFEAGYRFALMTAGVTPYAAVQAEDFQTPNYSETDATGGGFGLSYNSQNSLDTRSEVGARFDVPVAAGNLPLTLQARAAWAHDWVSNPALTAVFEALPGSAFIVNGAAMPHDSALAAAGAVLHITPAWSLTGQFYGEFASGSQIYAGSGALRYAW